MYRPKSAKPGAKIEYREQPSRDDQQQQFDMSNLNQHGGFQKKQRLLSANYRRGDRKIGESGAGVIGRILPKNIPQDKERLYFETIKLKQQMNAISEQNIKLKTKLIKLQKQNSKLGKAIEVQQSFDQRPKSRLHSAVMGNVQSNKVPTMKRLVRQAKDETEFLKAQNQRIKKAVKYSRLTQLQNQNKILIQQMSKMTKVIDELTQQQLDNAKFKKKIDELTGFLNSQIQQNHELQSINKQLQSDIYELEQQNRQNAQKVQQRQKRFIRNLEIQKRKFDAAQKEISNLKTDIQLLRNQNHEQVLSKKPLAKNNRNPIKKPQIPVGSTSPSIQQFQNELALLKKRNQELQKQNFHLSSTIKTQQQKLQATERSNKQIKIKNIEPKIQSKQNISDDNNEYNQYAEEWDEQDDYNDATQQNLKSNGKKSVIEQDNNHDDEQEEQILYQQDENKSPAGSKPKSAKKPGTKKKALSELKALLTYRMKALRYPFNQLEQNIKQTGDKQFKISDLTSMFHDQPFLLNDKQTKTILKHVSPDFKNPQATVSLQHLIKKLRAMINDFQLRAQQQQQNMYNEIAQMVTEYYDQLEQQFSKKGNKEDNGSTISEKKLRKLFLELGLQQNYINLIVTYLSLTSEDLDHLNYNEFFEHFLINDNQQQQNNQQNALGYVERIDEQQIEESQDSKTKLKSNFKKYSK